MNYVGPNINGETLLAAITELADFDVDAMRVELKSDLAVNKIDVYVEKHGILSTEQLLSAKKMASGLQVADPGTARPVSVLPVDASKTAGAIALDGPSPVVAFVEDLPHNIRVVSEALGREDFDVFLMTATQFTKWFQDLYADSGKVKKEAVSISDIFDAALSTDSSDIHLSVGQSPKIRVRGEIRTLPFQPLSEEWMMSELAKLVGDFKMNELAETHNCDAAAAYGKVRFRINLGNSATGMTAAIRRLPADIPTFDNIGLPTAVRKMCELERGLVLVTGPTGSGKSTTLASMLSHITTNQPRHVLTLEDPIEFVLPARAALVHQRELGQTFTSFADGLRQSLRQDPDVILVGEARDRETISAAVTAAETGALVFATLHTYDAASTLSRIVSSYPEGEQDHIRSALAYVLRGVISQTLLPALSGGRIAAYEVLVGTPAVSNNLRKVDGFSQLRQALASGGEHGMQTLEAHLAELVRNNKVSRADAEFKARDVDEFRRLLGGESK